MENLEVIGRWIVLIGVGLIVVGSVFWLLAKIPGIEHIPGNLKIELQGITCIIPIVGSVVLSVILTLILNLLVKVFYK